jgi:hypothetical protein
MKIKKYDYWIGLYEDKAKGIFYICLLPCILIEISYPLYDLPIVKIEVKIVRILLHIFISGWFIFLFLLFHKILFFLGL